MKENKKSKKIRFLPYFPYGYCSRHATVIEGKSNPTAIAIITGGQVDETVSACENHRKNSLDRARYLCEMRFAKDSRLRCGTPVEERPFRNLTQRGMTTFLEGPDATVPGEETEPKTQEEYNGNKKGSKFRSTSQPAKELREWLYSYASSQDTEDLAVFRNLLLETVQTGHCTPLSYGLNIASQLHITTAKYSQQQLYNIWRVSHINAMFLANDHLTYLDRRPHNTGFAIDGIYDEQSYQEYIKKHGITMAAYSYYALSNWYKDNPGFYQITQTEPDESEEARIAWQETPAYYSARELPTSENTATAYEAENARELNISYHAIHIGLAAGKNINYVCYHGKPGLFKWLAKREEITKTEIERAVRYMKTQNPDIPYNDKVDFALYFCTSHHQFLGIFERTKQQHKANKKLTYTTDKPYTSIHVIPVNDSGTFLLGCLMENAPMQMEETIRNSLISFSEDYLYQNNSLYPLTYKGKKVFFGYTMDIGKIHRALEDHLDGANFYIACFPEQISWYQKLMPGHEYL